MIFSPAAITIGDADTHQLLISILEPLQAWGGSIATPAALNSVVNLKLKRS
jgi:hypothetical protein